MTWIIPNKLSAFVPDTEASKLDLNERASILSQSLMWRSKRGPSTTWLKRLKQGSWVQHLSTRILNPSLTQDFEEKWTESLEDTHASRFPMQEKDLARKTPATSGLGSQMALDFASPPGSSSKTLKDTSPMGYGRLLMSWPEWVTFQRGEYSQRLKLALLIQENESIFTLERGKLPAWPTCAARDYKGTYKPESMIRKDGKDRSMDTLPQAVETVSSWPTPATADGGKIGCQPNYGQVCLSNHPAIVGQPDRGKLKKSGKPQESSDKWTTPTQDDANNRQGKYAQGGSSLSSQTNQWGTPRTQITRPGIFRDDPRGNLEEQVAEVHKKNKAKLNPDWVCQLMGIPPGWVRPEGEENRTDELRMLGNGVVPDTAARAILVLAEELDHE